MSIANRSGAFAGGALIVLGLAFLLNNFGLVPRGVFNLWPLLVMGAGVWLLGRAVVRRRGGGMTGGLLVLALGAFWLLNNYGVLGDQFFLPIILIALGAGMLLRVFVT